LGLIFFKYAVSTKGTALSNIWIANIIGIPIIFILAINYYYIKSRKWLLLMSVCASVLFGLSFYFTNQTEAYLISFVGIAVALLQSITLTLRIRLLWATLGISVVLFSYIPDSIFSGIPLAISVWSNLGATQEAIVMRAMNIAPPALWVIVCIHSQNYSLIPVDIFNLVSGILWFRKNVAPTY
jgi:hypothetical protein